MKSATLRMQLTSAQGPGSEDAVVFWRATFGDRAVGGTARSARAAGGAASPPTPSCVEMRIVVLGIVGGEAAEVLEEIDGVSLHVGAAGPRTAPKLPAMLEIGFQSFAARAAFGPVMGGPVHLRPSDRALRAGLDTDVAVFVRLVNELPLGDLVVLEIGVAHPAPFAEPHIEAVFGDDRQKGRKACLQIMKASPFGDDVPGFLGADRSIFRH